MAKCRSGSCLRRGPAGASRPGAGLAWREVFPHPEQPFSLKIRPGDSITASVKFSRSSHRSRLEVKDNAQARHGAPEVRRLRVPPQLRRGHQRGANRQRQPVVAGRLRRAELRGHQDQRRCRPNWRDQVQPLGPHQDHPGGLQHAPRHRHTYCPVRPGVRRLLARRVLSQRELS